MGRTIEFTVEWYGEGEIFDIEFGDMPQGWYWRKFIGRDSGDHVGPFKHELDALADAEMTIFGTAGRYELPKVG